MRSSRVAAAAYKQAAIDQWTADPCGAVGLRDEPGTRAYFDRLIEERLAYAPWMRDALDYAGTAGMDVLDVGCGQGIDLALYARAGARATGIDLTPRHVELARAHLKATALDGTVTEGDAEAMPFSDSSFDRVSSNGALHHTPDIDAAMQEIFRVLRPGGEARLIVYNRCSFHYWLSQVLWHGIAQRRLFRTRSMAAVMSETVEFTSIGARPLVVAYTPRELHELMAKTGFAEERTRVSHFRPDDIRPTRTLVRTVLGRRLFSPAVLDLLGRTGGWYVTGIGRKPV